MKRIVISLCLPFLVYVFASNSYAKELPVYDLLASFYNSTSLDLKLAEASNFTIDMDKVLLGESTIDNGGAVLMQTIPFTAVADEDIGGSSEQVLGITIA